MYKSEILFFPNVIKINENFVIFKVNKFLFEKRLKKCIFQIFQSKKNLKFF